MDSYSCDDGKCADLRGVAVGIFSRAQRPVFIFSIGDITFNFNCLDGIVPPARIMPVARRPDLVI